jgi:hypothetical protein
METGRQQGVDVAVLDQCRVLSDAVDERQEGRRDGAFDRAASCSIHDRSAHGGSKIASPAGDGINQGASLVAVRIGHRSAGR